MKCLSGTYFFGFANRLLRAFEILEDAYQQFFKVSCCNTPYKTELSGFVLLFFQQHTDHYSQSV